MGRIIEPNHSTGTIEKMVIDHLNRGIERKNHPFKNFVLSTTDGSMVDSRMVVLREHTNEPFILAAYTDIRSAKVDHLKNIPKASCLFWHPSAKLQVRVNASAMISNRDRRSKQAFADSTSFGKVAYNTIDAPGSLLDDFEWKPAKLRDDFDADYFAILDFKVYHMDVLQLSREGHIRTKFTYDETGKCTDAAFVTP